MVETPASSPILNVAATGAGLSSITSVMVFRWRTSPCGSVTRSVTGTIAASSARPGISMARMPLPSTSGRPLKTSWASPGHASSGAAAYTGSAAPRCSARPAAKTDAKPYLIMGGSCASDALSYTRKRCEMLFPLEFGKSRRGIPGIAFLEQFPLSALGFGRAPGRRVDRIAAPDQRADVSPEFLKIAPFVGERCRPGGDRTVPRHHARRRDAGEFVHHGEPAFQAA